MSDAFPNPEQEAVLARLEGALLVLAPAGTGKTRVMAERLARAIASGIPARRTLCLTFTNRAAGQMREQVGKVLGAMAQQSVVATFHGLCVQILREEAEELGLPRDFVIYDDEDQREVLRDVFTRTGTVVAKGQPARILSAWLERKSNAPHADLTVARVPRLSVPEEVSSHAEALREYQATLVERGALDFADLVFKVRSLLHCLPESRARWAARFDWIQVDEVQDTHFSEYDVIRALGERTRNVALFGDLDQTIYGWRGSDPQRILSMFAADLGPVTTLGLARNYRATRALLAFAERFAGTMTHRTTVLAPAPGLEEGERIEQGRAKTADGEAVWIATRCKKELARGREGRIGVLVRTNARASTLAQALARHQVPCLTVEFFEFFQRQEIKDAIARLRLVLQPGETGALRRVLARPASGIGDATLREIHKQGMPLAMRLSDFLREETHAAGDPFAGLLGALEAGDVVVLDTETTGKSPHEDQVVEVAAARLRGDTVVARYHALVRPTRAVGDSERIHGLSDAVLRETGRPGREVLEEVLAFVGTARLVGHNVGFDLAMLRSWCKREGIAAPAWRSEDTLEIARRLLRLESYRLDAVTRALGVRDTPTHRAEADVEATVGVLLELARRLTGTAPGRVELVRAQAPRFAAHAARFHAWRGLADSLEPARLLWQVLDESGLLAHYEREKARREHLEKIVDLFARRHDPSLDNRVSLERILTGVAMSKNVDLLPPGDPRIPVLTIHQSKGLEFDTVFVAGCDDGEIPLRFGDEIRDLEEEKRLFYVAITRAKRTLYLSGHDRDDWDRARKPSAFLAGLENGA